MSMRCIYIHLLLIFFFYFYMFNFDFFFFFQAEDGIRDKLVTGVQTCALRSRRHISFVGWAKDAFQAWRARPSGRARRARAPWKSSPSNTRLKLAAPGRWGRIPFVTNQPRRRRLSAGR